MIEAEQRTLTETNVTDEPKALNSNNNDIEKTQEATNDNTNGIDGMDSENDTNSENGENNSNLIKEQYIREKLTYPQIEQHIVQLPIHEWCRKESV